MIRGKALALFLATAFFVGAGLMPMRAGEALTGLTTGPHDVDISARQITSLWRAHPEMQDFGPLHFIGGLELLSSNPFSHSLSGLWLTADGSGMIGITDSGASVSATIERDAEGRPIGFTHMKGALLTDADGRSLVIDGRNDCESVDVFKDKTGKSFAYASFEGPARVARAEIDADGLLGPLSFIKIPPETQKLSANKSLESVTRRVDGALLLVAEGTLPGEQLARGWLGKPNAKASEGFDWISFFIGNSEDYEISDAKFMPNGDVLLLERSFHLPVRFGMRLRLISAKSLKANATVDGETLITADPSDEIDNMEGLAVYNYNGKTRIALVSDDNNFALQRGIYLEFEFLR